MSLGQNVTRPKKSPIPKCHTGHKGHIFGLDEFLGLVDILDGDFLVRVTFGLGTLAGVFERKEYEDFKISS